MDLLQLEFTKPPSERNKLTIFYLG